MNIQKYLPLVVSLLIAVGVSACGSGTPIEQPTLHPQVTQVQPDSLVPNGTFTRTPFPSSTPLVTWTPLPTNTIDPNPSSTTQASNLTYETRYINTTNPSVNLRDGAGVSFGVVGSLENGSQIRVVGEQTTSDGFVWYQIIYLDGTAWIYSDLTSLTRPSVQLVPTQAPQPMVVAGCTCNAPDLDCSYFSNSVEAQACYNKCMAQVGSDVYRLDGEDNDGWACEDLP